MIKVLFIATAVSWMTMYSFAQLGRVRHNKADGKGDTTVPTTKGREWMLC